LDASSISVDQINSFVGIGDLMVPYTVTVVVLELEPDLGGGISSNVGLVGALRTTIPISIMKEYPYIRYSSIVK
jgi:hypothetical protein